MPGFPPGFIDNYVLCNNRDLRYKPIFSSEYLSGLTQFSNMLQGTWIHPPLPYAPGRFVCLDFPAYATQFFDEHTFQTIRPSGFCEDQSPVYTHNGATWGFSSSWFASHNTSMHAWCVCTFAVNCERDDNDILSTANIAVTNAWLCAQNTQEFRARASEIFALSANKLRSDLLAVSSDADIIIGAAYATNNSESWHQTYRSGQKSSLQEFSYGWGSAGTKIFTALSAYLLFMQDFPELDAEALWQKVQGQSIVSIINDKVTHTPLLGGQSLGLLDALLRLNGSPTSPRRDIHNVQ